MHCCTESAPGRRLADELELRAALQLADAIIQAEVPYVMLCGGEPLISPLFFPVAERLGQGGVRLKIETNGQHLDGSVAARLARLPIRSVQVSLDADSPEVYRRQRAGGELETAHAACRAVRAADLPLEVTFAPTRINIHEADAVITRARALGAFRFNTGQLMRIGTAARHWQRLQPDAAQYRGLLETLHRHEGRGEPHGSAMQLCYQPFTLQEGLRGCLEQVPATLLILPNGYVKVAAALGYVCADLRTQTLSDAWASYRRAWRSDLVLEAARRALADESVHARANTWHAIGASVPSSVPLEEG